MTVAQAHGGALGGRDELAEAVEDRGRAVEVGRVGRDRLDRRPPHLGLQRGRRALGHDAAVVDDPDAVGEDVGLLQVLRGQEDGHAVLARQPADLAPERGAALDVEAGRRLVEEEDLRPVHERERQVEPALHPARVAAHLAVGGLAQADAAEQLVGALRPLGARDPLQRGLQAQVLAAGQERVERGLLQRRADVHPHLRALLDDVEAGDARAARGRRQQRRQHVHGRRLAGAVRAEEAVDLAGLRRRGRSRRPRAGLS